MKKRSSSEVSSTSYRAGDEVEVFFRFSQDVTGGCFPVLDACMPLLPPLVGWTDCWVRAIVLTDWPPAHGTPAAHVHVCHAHPIWCSKKGDVLTDDDRHAVAQAVAAAAAVDPAAAALAAATGSSAEFLPEDVRRRARDAPRPRPIVSVLAIRWGGAATPFDEAQWGGLSSSVSDRYIGCFCDDALHACLGSDYEVLSVFVRSGEDLCRLQPSALAARLSGRHKAALYFLWPTRFQDGTKLQQMGMVGAAPFFGAMEGIEAAGIPTRFPHPSQLYRTLLTKEWQARG